MFAPKLVYKLRKNISTVFYDGRIVPRHTETEHFYEDTTDGLIYPSVTARTGILEKKHLKQWAANQAVDSLLEFISSRSSFEPFELAEAARAARDAHKKRLDQASDWGTQAHDLVDNYVRLWIAGNRPNKITDIAPEGISDEAVSAALAAESFFNDYTLFPIVSEKKLVSKKYAYGGTLDTLFLIGSVIPGHEGKEGLPRDWRDGPKNTIVCKNSGRIEQLQILLLDLKTSNQVLNNYSYANQVGAYSQALTEMVKIKPTVHWILQVSKARPKYDIAVIPNIEREIKGFLMMNQLAQYVESLDNALVPLKQKNRIIL